MAHSLGQFDAAVELIGAAAAINPAAPQFHFNLGVSLQALGKNPEASAAYRRALNLKPDYLAAYENLGVALQDSDESEAADAAYRSAIAIDPESAIARLNLGTLHNNDGASEEASLHFSKVLGLKPAYGEAHWKYALARLALGDFEQGWRAYEWRRHAESFVGSNPTRVVPFPSWDGSPLEGKIVLITAEQGIGDEIMFASCYRDVIERAHSCVIECDPRLAAAFERSFPEAEFIPTRKDADFCWHSQLAAIDFKVAAGSLPLHFRPSLASFPERPSYLVADVARQAAWRAQLDELPHPVSIGISWRGGKETRASRARSVPLEAWQPLFAATAANFVDLQYGDHRAEIDAFHRAGLGQLHSLEGLDPIGDVDGFMSLLPTLDLVISIDNSTVFMAGAIGAPTWVLLPASAEWRWLKDRSTSPWHSSLRLFRQGVPGMPAWRALIEDVALRLSAHV
jgi:Flp pilus assembly protein TadD